MNQGCGRKHRCRPAARHRRAVGLRAPVVAGLASAFLLHCSSSPGLRAQPPAERVFGPARALARLESAGALRFEANVGQTDPRVKFFARAAGYMVFLTATEAVFTSPAAPTPAASVPGVRPVADSPVVRRMRIVGASPAPVIGQDELSAKSHYFIGNDRTKWHTGVPMFGRVRYHDVYPGIDLLFYGRAGQLEFDFVVSAGADPGRIALALEGPSGVEPAAIGPGGEFLWGNSPAPTRLETPLIYQEVSGVRRRVSGDYIGRGRSGSTTEVGFALGPYDTSRVLIIDPVLSHSTYLGGSVRDWAEDIAIDADGSSYVAGVTQSPDFPTQNPLQPLPGDGRELNVFVAKLSPAGDELRYATYLAGNNFSNRATGITVDSEGNAYITGSTNSADFPTTAGAFQEAHAGGGDAFVTKLAPSGAALVYSTYLGGSGTEDALGVALDDDGSAYVTGSTSSPDFPTLNPIQDMLLGTANDPFETYGFVTKLDPSGSALVYSTYLGGRGGGSVGTEIVVDAAANAYISGTTTAPDFPVTAGVAQGVLRGASDGFVGKISPSGTELIYSTFLGGSDEDSARSIAVDSEGQAHVVGQTRSLDFPTVNAFQPRHGGAADAFAAKLDAGGRTLVYSTFLGGRGTATALAPGIETSETATEVALDRDGNAYVAGTTNSPVDFPTLNAFDARGNGTFDAFVTQLAPSGAVLFSTYLGGDGIEGANGIAVDGAGDLYVAGVTYPGRFPNFPVVNPFQGFPRGTGDAFVAKIAMHSTAQQCVYVVNDLTGEVTVIEAARKTTMGRFAVGAIGDRLDGIVFSPDGGRAYVVDSGVVFLPAASSDRQERPARGESFVAIIDTRTHRVAATISLGNPRGGLFQPALAPDGATLYVSDGRRTFVVDVATGTVLTTIPVGVGEGDLVMAPDGRRLYMIRAGDPDSVAVVDTATNAVSATLSFPVRNEPTGGAVSPDGASLYVTLMDASAVAVIDTATNTVRTMIEVPGAPNRIAITPDGAEAWVTHFGFVTYGIVSVIDTAEQRVSATIALERPADDIALTPDGKFAYVSNAAVDRPPSRPGAAGTVTVIDTKTRQLAGIIPVGDTAGALAIATLPNGCNVDASCTGDCDGDGVVEVNELVLGVNIALGFLPAADCRAFDANADATVSIDELVDAVDHMLNGCAAA